MDDEPKALSILERYCKDIDDISLEGTFRDPVKAIRYLQDNKVDLIFLDINMPKVSGLEFLEMLKTRPKVIFTTAYSEYAIESYDYEAVDYLLKPIAFHRFLKSVSKVTRLISAGSLTNTSEKYEKQNEKVIYIKSGPQLHKVKISDILYLQKDGNYLIFHTHSKKMLSRQNMKDLFELLDPNEFVRVHKSFVVALRHIEVIEAHQIRIGKIKIPTGRIYREGLMNSIGKENNIG